MNGNVCLLGNERKVDAAASESAGSSANRLLAADQVSPPAQEKGCKKNNNMDLCVCVCERD